MALLSSSSTKLRIGIVGFGNFGQFLAKTMIRQGHSLRVASRTDYTELCDRLGVSFFRDMGEFLESDNDVILICTSIVSFSDVLQTMPLHRIKRPLLFVDVLSVKEHPRNVLLQVLPEECDVLCTHPMFGPESGKNGWKGLTVVYERVRIRDRAMCSNLLRVFETEGCKMVDMPCEEHDRLAARSQFLTHAIGRMLSAMDIKSTSVNTKGFESLLQLKENTMEDSFDLFRGLFIHNRFARQELKNIEFAFHDVKQKLFQGCDLEKPFKQ